VPTCYLDWCHTCHFVFKRYRKCEIWPAERGMQSYDALLRILSIINKRLNNKETSKCVMPRTGAHPILPTHIFYKQAHLCSMKLRSIQCTPLKSDIYFILFSETADVELTACKTRCDSIKNSGRNLSTSDAMNAKTRICASLKYDFYFRYRWSPTTKSAVLNFYSTGCANKKQSPRKNAVIRPR